MPGRATELAAHLRAGIDPIIVGNEQTSFGFLLALLGAGHILVEGVPGTAKTLFVRLLAALLGAPYRRIQFTPDLMPADVVGTTVFNPQTGEFSLRRGPIFTNLLLADEINRTPPKTQSALLEAMEERQVTIDGESEPLAEFFFVCATQNPIEFEGTYPLPEAQLDRFFVRARTGYPSEIEERTLLTRSIGGFDAHDLAAAGVRPVATIDDVLAARHDVRAIYVADALTAYAYQIVARTRASSDLSLGASPRAGLALLARNASRRRHRRPRLRDARRRQSGRAARPSAPRHRAARSRDRRARRRDRRRANSRRGPGSEGRRASRYGRLNDAPSSSRRFGFRGAASSGCSLWRARSQSRALCPSCLRSRRSPGRRTSRFLAPTSSSGRSAARFASRARRYKYVALRRPAALRYRIENRGATWASASASTMRPSRPLPLRPIHSRRSSGRVRSKSSRRRSSPRERGVFHLRRGVRMGRERDRCAPPPVRRRRAARRARVSGSLRGRGALGNLARRSTALSSRFAQLATARPRERIREPARVPPRRRVSVDRLEGDGAARALDGRAVRSRAQPAGAVVLDAGRLMTAADRPSA